MRACFRLSSVLAVGLLMGACHGPGPPTTRSKPATGEVMLVVRERGASPSGMPWEDGELLDPASSRCILAKSDIRPNGFVAWSFYGGTLEPDKMVLENVMFFFAMDPDHIRPMMRGLGELHSDLLKKLKDKQQGCL